MSEKPAMVFDPLQVKEFVKGAKKRVGGEKAWEFVGPEVQKMALEAEAFRVMSVQVASAQFNSDVVRKLGVMMYNWAKYGVMQDTAVNWD